MARMAGEQLLGRLSDARGVPGCCGDGGSRECLNEQERAWAAPATTMTRKVHWPRSEILDRGPGTPSW